MNPLSTPHSEIQELQRYLNVHPQLAHELALDPYISQTKLKA